MTTAFKNKFRFARDADVPGGSVVLAERKIEPHLSIVIAEREVEYVRWWFNHQTGGFFWGDYYRKEGDGNEAYQKVWADFNETVERRNRL